MTTDHIYREFADQLAAFIGKHVAGTQDGEDVLQQVFLKIHRYLQHRPPPRHLRGWVYQIARRAMIDHVRRNRARPVVALAGDTESLLTDGTPPDVTRELSHCLGKLIDGLPRQYAQALRTTELDGLTQLEAAERAGVSLSGMKSRVQRGREKLRDALLACCEIELDARRNPVAHRCRTQCGCKEGGQEIVEQESR